MSDIKNKKSLTTEQKTGFVLLLVFAFLVIGLGFLQIRNTVYNPFAINVDLEDYEISSLFQNEEERLKNIDTDQDGLYDYDEISIYETSAYLADTDSDGISDREEIEMGSDPLCPEGEDCVLSEKDYLSTTTPNFYSPLLDDFDFASSPTTSEISGAVANNFDLNSIFPTDGGSMDVVSLRQMVLDNNILTKDELDKIPDDELTSLVFEFLSEQEALATDN